MQQTVEGPSFKVSQAIVKYAHKIFVAFVEKGYIQHALHCKNVPEWLSLKYTLVNKVEWSSYERFVFSFLLW